MTQQTVTPTSEFHGRLNPHDHNPCNPKHEASSVPMSQEQEEQFARISIINRIAYMSVLSLDFIKYEDNAKRSLDLPEVYHWLDACIVF